ncbi:hypothetical protein GW17_00033719 [Ensete ventricosum]|nr:hypothetical protein GW17_00033719 [Ensete ventricosum]
MVFSFHYRLGPAGVGGKEKEGFVVWRWWCHGALLHRLMEGARRRKVSTWMRPPMHVLWVAGRRHVADSGQRGVDVEDFSSRFSMVLKNKQQLFMTIAIDYKECTRAQHDRLRVFSRI